MNFATSNPHALLRAILHVLVIISLIVPSFDQPPKPVYASQSNIRNEESLPQAELSSQYHQLSSVLPVADLDPPPCPVSEEEEVIDLILASGESCKLAAGEYIYTNVTIQTGGALIIEGDSTSVMGTGVILRAKNLTIEPGGTITATGEGFPGGAGPGAGVTANGGSAGGGGHGGWGGTSTTPGGSPYNDVYRPVALGSGGGNRGTAGGGAGGGAIHFIIENTLVNSGMISANGTIGGESFGGAGGGSGGSIWIEAHNFSGNGLIAANGGEGRISGFGGAYGIGGGGAGGRIAINYHNSNSFTGSVQAYGGVGYQSGKPDRSGGPGTIYWEPEAKLVVDNNGKNLLSAGLPEANYTFATIATIDLVNGGNLLVMGESSSIDLQPPVMVAGGGKLTAEGTVLTPVEFILAGYQLSPKKGLQGAQRIILNDQGKLNLYAEGSPTQDGVYVFDQIIVNGGATLGLVSYNNGDANYLYPSGGDYGVTLVVNEFLTVDGTLSAVGMGYSSGIGPGADSANKVGGSYGGVGGTTNVAYPGRPGYGSITQPVDLGSGGGPGGTSSQPGANGGGAMKLLINGVLTVNGVISANGESKPISGTSGAGGSGGSIWIDAEPGKTLTFAGSSSGLIQANGGDGSAGGGGGRIAIYADSTTFEGSITAYGGNRNKSDSTKGGDGTIYRRGINVDGSTVAIQPETITVGGTGTISVRIVDDSDQQNPIVGKPVEVTLSSGEPVLINGEQVGFFEKYINLGNTNEDGIVTGTISTNIAGNRKIEARTGQVTVSSAEEGFVNFVSGTVDKTHSEIVASWSEAPADGLSTVTLTVTVRDAFDNPISGKAVTLSSNSSTAVIDQPTGVTTPDGTFVTTIKNSERETINVQAFIEQDPEPLAPSATISFKGADLIVSQSAQAPTNQGPSNTKATAGHPITYTIRVDNQGLMKASEVTLTDTLPEGFHYQSSSGNCSAQGRVITCLIGEMNSGSRSSIEIEVLIDAGTWGTVENQVSVSTISDEEDVNNNFSELETLVELPAPLIRVQSTTASLEAQPGSSASTKVQIFNDGLESTGTISFSLPAHFNGWVDVSPATLTAIPAQSYAEITVSATAPSDKEFGKYLGNLIVSDSLGGQDKVLITVFVARARRAMEITVQNDNAELVSGARLLLTRKTDEEVQQSYIRINPDGGQSSYIPQTYEESGLDGKVVLRGVEEGTYTYQLVADYHELGSGTISVQSGTEPQEETLQLIALPGLYVEPAQALVSVVPGEQASQTVKIRNTGASSLTGIQIQKVNLPNWVTLVLPSPIPDIPAKKDIEITIYANPPADLPAPNWIAGKILVDGGGLQASFGLTVAVISPANRTRDVRFNVKDISGDPITTRGMVVLTRVKPVEGSVNGHTYVYQPKVPATLDESGTALFRGLDIGEEYTYQAWADDYSLTSGSIFVQPPEPEQLPALLQDGVPFPNQISASATNVSFASSGEDTTQNKDVLLKTADFEYIWTVEEIPGGIDLSYKVTLEVKPKNPNDPDYGEEGTIHIWYTGPNGNNGGFFLPPDWPRPRVSYTRMQLSQTVILAWQAFSAHLEIENTSSADLVDIQATVHIIDSTGADRTEDFAIQPGVALPFNPIQPRAQDARNWIIIPKGTGITTPTDFQAYAVIDYKIGGVSKSLKTVPEYFKVNPAPNLKITYTIPDHEEGCLEFDIKAKIVNEGFGDAKNLRVTSEQPTVELEPGDEPVNFEITNAWLGSIQQPNALNITIGDLAKESSVDVIWRFRASRGVRLVSAVGALQQEEGVQNSIPAISSVETQVVPAACLARPVPKKSRRDSEPCDDGSYTCSQGHEGGPINTQTGTYDFSASDLSISTLAGPIQFKRWYSTGAIDYLIVPIGNGWSHSLDQRLNIPNDPKDKVLSVKLSSTNEFMFGENLDGTYTAFPGLFGKLSKSTEPEVTYTYISPDQAKYIFDHDGYLLTYQDPQQHTLNYEYEAGVDGVSKRLKRVSDQTNQRFLAFEYYTETEPSTGLLKRVFDHTGRQVTFQYSLSGDLEYVFDVLNQKWVYTYENHRLTSVGVEVQTSSGPEIKILERTEFDSEGRAYRQYNGNNELVVGLDYASAPSSGDPFEATEKTTIFDALGNETTHEYDSAGTLVSEISATGEAVAKAYNFDYRPSILNDPAGNETNLTWGNDGAVLEDVVSADGSSFHMDYDDANNLLSYEDPLGNASTFTYNGSLLESQTDALGNITNYQYTSTGQLERVTDPSGQTTEYHYDAFGQVEWVKQNGLQTNYYYDELGRVVKVIDPQGNINFTCHDKVGRPVRTVYSPSEPSSNPCDSVNFQPGTFDRVTDTYYDHFGNVIATVDPDGIVTRTFYDGANRTRFVVQNLRDPGNANATIDQLLALMEPPLFDPAFPEQNIVSETRYDAAGNVIASIDSDGTITRTYYDAQNRVEYMVRNLVGQDISVEVPPIGQPVAGVDLRSIEQNITTQTVYDDNGNVIASIQLLPGCTVTTEQDIWGNRTTSLSAACRVSRTYYDVVNRPISTVQNWKGIDLLDPNPPTPVSANPDQNVRTDTIYDLAGNAIATVSVQPGCVITRTTGADGSPIVRTSDGCRVDRTYFDALNRPEYSVSNLKLQEGAEDEITLPLDLTILERTQEKNLITQSVYDSAGRIIATIQILPGCTVTRSTRVENQKEIPTYSASPECLVTRTYFDEQGRTKVTAQNLYGQPVDEGYTTPPPYDPAYPDRNVPGSQPIYESGTGRNLANVDPLGRIVRTYYDPITNLPYKTIRNLRDPNNPDAALEQLLALPVPPAYDASDPARADWNITTETYYDAEGRAIATVDPLGFITRTYYDTLGRSFMVTRNLKDPNNLNTSVNDLLSLSEPPLFDNDHPDWNITTESVYGVDGKTIATVSAAKEGCDVAHQPDGSIMATNACIVTRTYFDVLDRPFAVVQNLAGQAISDPNLPSNSDANLNNDLTTEANIITYTLYDAAGQAIAMVEPGIACEVQHLVDGSYNVGSGCIVHRTYFDELGRQIATVQNLVGQAYSVVTPPERDMIPPYEHPDQNVRTDTIYDSAGNATDQVDPKGIVTHYIYDEQGRLVEVIENFQAPFISTEKVNVRTIYEYDAQGNRTAIRSANAVLAGSPDKTTFLYDKLGRLTAEIDPLNHKVEYGYDIFGNRVSQKDAYGNETRFIFDGVNRLKTIDYPEPDQDVTYSYGPTELRKAMVDSLGTTTWTYDDLGRVESVTDPLNKTVQYAYDGNGNRTQLIYPDNKTVTYAYSPLGRLSQLKDWRNQITDYAYRANGQLNTVALPNGVVSTFQFNGAGRLQSLQHQKDGELLSSYEYDYDPAGNRTQVTEVMPPPDPGDIIFEDGFETGDLTSWSGSTTDNGDLDVSSQAALLNGFGMNAVLDDNVAIYVTDQTPESLVRYRARFYFDTNSVAMVHGNIFTVFGLYNASSQEITRVELRYSAGDYQLRAVIARDSGSVVTPWVTITDSPHSVELDWQAASAVGANNGSFILWIDGQEQGNLAGIDNDTRRTDSVRLGVQAVDTGTRGTLYFDGFESRTENYIGPEPYGPVADPFPPKTDALFNDGFESGDFSAWSVSATDSGDLSASSQAAMLGSYGMQAVLDDNAAIYVTDYEPFEETHYRARFYLDPNSIAMNHGETLSLLSLYDHEDAEIVRIELRQSAGDYQISVISARDSSWFSAPWTTVSDSPHSIELDWRAATAVGANNGETTLWIDGQQQVSLTAIDNDTRRTNYMRFGVQAVDPGTRGTLYLDGFESRTENYIGPDPLGPVADPFPPKMDALFSDGFESGSFSAWSLSTTDGGDLSVSSPAAMLGSYGMQAVIDDGAAIYVTDYKPFEETHYRARFYFDPNSLSMLHGNAFRIFEMYNHNNSSLGFIEFRYSAGDYQVRAYLYRDSDAVVTPWTTISDSPHSFEIDWRAASAVGANDGSFTLWMDGQVNSTVTSIDNDTLRVEYVRLGAVAGVEATNSGVLYFDGFESRTENYIGPEPYGPVADPFPPKTETLFSDGFESGDFSAWSVSATDSGDLSASSQAAMLGSYGMQAVMDDNASIYVTDYKPFEETRYRARFYFDPNSLAMAHGEEFTLFGLYDHDNAEISRLEIQYMAGDYQLRAVAAKDSGSLVTPWVTITDSPHSVELDWQAASAVGANNGSFTLWIDGQEQGNLTGIDNDTQRVDYVRFGIQGVNGGTRGTLYFDGFESRRENYIGLDPAGPVADPFPPKTDALFSDGFENGSFSAWSASRIDSGDLSVSSPAAMMGSYGMQAVLDDNALIYLTDYTPFEETHYRARFYFDPNTIGMGSTDAHYLFYGLDRNGSVGLRIEFRKASGVYQVRADAANNSGWTNNAWTTITDEPHQLEINWQAASADNALDGRLEFWVDQVQQINLSTLDNDLRRIDYVQLGAVAGVDTGTRGTYYFDGFESRRETYIGPDGFSQPQSTPASLAEVLAPFGFDAANFPAPMESSGVGTPTSVTITYTYDELYRLTAANYSDGSYFHYSYDSNGNRLTETTQAGTVTSIYDSANRLTSVGGVAYTWDDNGNLLSDGVQTYTYDRANRLKTVTQGAIITTFAYNGLGDRVRETANGSQTDFVLDLNTGLTQVLQDGSYSYLYGHARLAQDNGNQMDYFLGDALGSVRQIADASGRLTLSKHYEPYGELLSSEGSGSTSYGFTGEYNSSSTNLLYLRARFYNPLIGRFQSKDSWLGKQVVPMSYNKWLYGYANPVTNTDPTGLEPCRNNSRYCLLTGEWNGAFIDVFHWWAAVDIAQDIDEKLSTVKGKEDALINLKHKVSLITVSGYYRTNLPAQLNENVYNGVILGVFMAFENDIETTETFDPTCLLPSGKFRSHECSGYANEDLPSDYLGYLTHINRWERNIEEIVERVFEVEGEASNVRPADARTDPKCIYLGQCDDNTSYNRCWDFKILNDNGKYLHKSFPEEYIVKPAKRGDYWDIFIPEPVPGLGFQ